MKKLHYSKDIKRKMAGRKSPAFRINWKEVGSCSAAIIYGIGVAGLFLLYLFFG